MYSLLHKRMVGHNSFTDDIFDARYLVRENESNQIFRLHPLQLLIRELSFKFLNKSVFEDRINFA